MTQQNKKLNYFHQTIQRVLQGVAINRDAILIGVFGFIGLLSKYSYILAKSLQGTDPYPMFGYKYPSQFFWAMGNELFSISMGVIIFVGAKFLVSDNTRLKSIFRLVAVFSIATGFYFMGWIFSQFRYEPTTEIIMAVVFSIVITSLFIPFLMYLTREIQAIKDLKSKISFMYRSMVVKQIDLDLIKDMEVFTNEIIVPVVDKLDE